MKLLFEIPSENLSHRDFGRIYQRPVAWKTWLTALGQFKSTSEWFFIDVPLNYIEFDTYSIDARVEDMHVILHDQFAVPLQMINKRTIALWIMEHGLYSIFTEGYVWTESESHG